MRKGEKFRSLDEPIDRRTRAPTPSDCSIARNDWRIALGTVIFVGFCGAKKVGGTSGRPKKDVELEVGLVDGPYKGFWDV